MKNFIWTKKQKCAVVEVWGALANIYIKQKQYNTKALSRDFRTIYLIKINVLDYLYGFYFNP